VQTVVGATYTLSLDVAGRVGYSADYTRMGIYVDGVRIGGDDSTSGNSGLNWQTRQFAFTGNGSRQTIRIVSEATRRDANGRGMMLDDIRLTERLPLNTGWEDTVIRLSAITAALVDTDGSETLSLWLAGLPAGTTLTDGTRTLVMGNTALPVNLTGWSLSTLSLTPPLDYHGTLHLQVIARATEQSTGAYADTVKELVVTVLPVNDAPTAANVTYTVQRNGSIRIDLAGLVDDVDGDRLTLCFTDMPDNGSLSRNVDGSYTYTPRRNFTGSDRLVFRVSDGLATAQGEITLRVVGASTGHGDQGCHGQSIHAHASAGERNEHRGYALASTRNGEGCQVNWSGACLVPGAYLNGGRVMDDELELTPGLGLLTGLVVRR